MFHKISFKAYVLLSVFIVWIFPKFHCSSTSILFLNAYKNGLDKMMVSTGTLKDFDTNLNTKSGTQTIATSTICF